MSADRCWRRHSDFVCSCSSCPTCASSYSSPVTWPTSSIEASQRVVPREWNRGAHREGHHDGTRLLDGRAHHRLVARRLRAVRLGAIVPEGAADRAHARVARRANPIAQPDSRRLSSSSVSSASRIALAGLVDALRHRVVIGGVAALVLYTLVGFAVWWIVSWWLPHGDCDLLGLVPGAAVFAIGIEVLQVITVVWFPHSMESKSEIYGTIGTALALLLWAYLLGRLMAVAAAFNVALWSRRTAQPPPPPTLIVSLPFVGDRIADAWTRITRPPALTAGAPAHRSTRVEPTKRRRPVTPGGPTERPPSREWPRTAATRCRCSPGRRANEPCPCGSGSKAKYCHQRSIGIVGRPMMARSRPLGS